MITPRQHRLLQFITGYIETHGYSPSIAEMAKALSITNSPTHWILTKLEERGFICRLPHRARAIEVLRAPSIPRSPEGEPLFFQEVKHDRT